MLQIVVVIMVIMMVTVIDAIILNTVGARHGSSVLLSGPG